MSAGEPIPTDLNSNKKIGGTHFSELSLYRLELAADIMREPDLISDQGSIEEASGMYDAAKYILTGSWEWNE
jgi:hypothetical protein